MTATATDVGHTPRPTTRPRRRRVGLLLTAASAVALILVCDRLVRARQSLITGLLAHDVQVLIPFADTLTSKAEKKTTWNNLHAQIAAARASNNRPVFVKSSYDLATFIEAELSPDDPRRRQVLLDLVAVVGEAPEAADAYWNLLSPTWRKELQPAYPSYVSAVSHIAATKGKENVSILIRLAEVLRESGETQLETQVLRSVHSAAPVTVMTADAMTRLVSLLPPTDVERTAVTEQLALYEKRRVHLTESMKWYANVLAKPATSAADLEAQRANAPTGPMNSFIASVDARLVELYLRDGRVADANRLRIAIAGYDLGDTEEASVLVSHTYSEVPSPGKPVKTPPKVTNIPMPNLPAIQISQWRGLLLTGKMTEADQLADLVFASDMKSLRKPADDEKHLLMGQLSKLPTFLTLEKKTDNLPPELSPATEAWYGKFTLKPSAKATPANVQSAAELWLSDDKGVIVFNADEPRKDLPPSKMTSRDQDVWKENCVEFFFDPDRWFDVYFQIDVNSVGTAMDARILNSGSTSRRQYKTDKTFNLDLSAKASQTATGWQVRLVFPREKLFPKDINAIKFNVRRMRQVTEKGQTILQMYTWGPSGTADHRPEQFGWVVIRK